MDPTSSLIDSINQAASSRSPSAQDVLAHASTAIASSEQVAPQRTTSAPTELAALERAMSDPAGNGATDIVAIEVNGDDSQPILRKFLIMGLSSLMIPLIKELQSLLIH